jgi:cupin 2 domain-containing protein
VISGNIFDRAEPPSSGEVFEPLLTIENLVVERILSTGKTVPTEYRQTQHEWVLLLRGEASLSVAGEVLVLKAGDYVFLEAGTPHTVLEVSDAAVWLGVHLHPAAAGRGNDGV